MSYGGLARVSIDLQKLIFEKRWMAGSGPAMTQWFGQEHVFRTRAAFKTMRPAGQVSSPQPTCT
jgi:hypothetical protein